VMTHLKRTRLGVAWLELLLALAVVALLFQLFPQLRQIALWVIDVRNWPRTMWFVANLIVVIVLLAVRFGPGLVEDWRERQARLAAEQEKRTKQQELKAQREALERMKQSQRRRIW